MNDIVLRIVEYTNKLISKNFNGITLEELLELFPLEEAINVILTNEEIVIMLNDYDCFEQYINFLCQIKYEKKSKIITNLTEADIQASRRPHTNNNQMSEEDIKNIFKALEHNLELYEKLYKNKIYKIETTINKTVLLNIGHAKLFHLLGFDLLNWQRNYRQEIIRVIPELQEVLNENYVRMCQDNDVKLYKALEEILRKENDIISSILAGDRLSEAILLQKVKTKNFAFERLGIVGAPAGIIFYDKNKDPFGNRNQIKSDIFLLRDFLQSFNLKWIFNGYAHNINIRRNTRNHHSIIRAKNVETLLIEPDISNKFIDQEVAITSSIGSMDRDKFNFKVSTLASDESGEDLIPNETQFSKEEMNFMAEKVIASFPELDLQHLKAFITTNNPGRNR